MVVGVCGYGPWVYDHGRRGVWIWPLGGWLWFGRESGEVYDHGLSDRCMTMVSPEVDFVNSCEDIRLGLFRKVYVYGASGDFFSPISRKVYGYGSLLPRKASVIVGSFLKKPFGTMGWKIAGALKVYGYGTKSTGGRLFSSFLPTTRPYPST